MPVCPFCQAPLALPSLPCGACGKRLIDHPSSSAGKSYSARPEGRTSGRMEAIVVPPLSGEVPELELASRHAPKPPPSKAPSLPPPPMKKPVAPRTLGASAPPKVNPAASPGVGGAVFDEDDIFSQAGGGLGGAIELETLPEAPRAGTVFSSPPPGTGLAPPPPRSSGALAGPVSRAPLAAPPEPSADDTEAAALADYGASPSSFWQSPLYAYRVKTRQSELRRQLREREADLGGAQKAEERARVAFAERARPIAEKSTEFARALEPIARAEKVLFERDGALSAELKAHEGRLAVIDERVQRLTLDLETARAEEREIAGKLEAAEAVRQRAEARLKRAEIEIRNVTAVAEASGARRAPVESPS